MPRSSTHTGLTRGQVARRLGVTVTTVVRKEKSGALPFTIDDDGIHRFRAEDVEKVRISPTRRRKELDTPGEVAAYAFNRFRGGATARDLVVELKITPERARALFEMWMSPDLTPPEPKPRPVKRVADDL